VPLYERTSRFLRDYEDLTPEQRAQVKVALREFLEDLPSRQFRRGLRVKQLRGYPGVWEMTWEYHDGRATFEYGDTSKGEPDVVWRRIGSHAIYREP
jgi:hypothetical protein